MGLLHKHHETKLVSYPIQQILRLKMKIQTDPKLAALVGKRIKADKARYFAQRVQDRYIKSAQLEALASSVLFLAGGRLKPERFKRLCWCLAAGTNKLRRGEVLKPWKVQFADEWVPLQVMDVVAKRAYGGKVGALVTCKALAGTCCDISMTRFWSASFARFIARKIGFTRERKLDRMEQLVGLRLYGLVERERSREAPFFDAIDITSTFIAHNRLLIAQRAREGFECPQKRKHPCFLCPVGYDVCRLATHPRSYVKAKCSVCKEDKFTDPLSLTLEICVDCQRSERFSRKKD